MHIEVIQEEHSYRIVIIEGSIIIFKSMTKYSTYDAAYIIAKKQTKALNLELWHI